MNFLHAFALVLLLLLQGQPAGTATISGRVLRVGTNEPIAGAEITLGRGATRIPPVISDNNGAFLITGVEPGRYMAMATKLGYAAQPYGASQPGLTTMTGVSESTLSEMLTMIGLEGGKTVNDIVFQMTPAAIIAGRVVGASGEPLAGIQIELLPTSYDSAGRRPMFSLARTSTNDRGEFRLFNVEPGRYYLSASWSPSAMVLQVPGGLPADYVPGTPANKKYVATYYPGVSDPGRAEVIDIKSGEERTDLRFPMLTGSQQTFQVRGRFLSATTGQPPSIQSVLAFGVQMIPRNADFLNSIAASDPHLSVDGSFEIRDVQPGSYWLNVRSAPPIIRPADPQQPMVSPRLIVASIPLEIVAANVEGLTVMMAPSTTIAGRVHVDEKEWPTGDPTAIAGWGRMRAQLNVTRVGTLPMNSMPDPMSSALQVDGKFVSDQVYPGEYRLTISGLPAGFYVKTAQFGEVDAVVQSFLVSGPSSSALDIVISGRTGQLSGVVSDSAKKPASNAQVVLIPEVRNKRPDLYRTAKTGADGTFTITDIVPGDYQLFAWDELRRFEYFDPELVRLSESEGKPIHVEEDSKQSAEVTVIHRPQ